MERKELLNHISDTSRAVFALGWNHYRDGREVLESTSDCLLTFRGKRLIRIGAIYGKQDFAPTFLAIQQPNTPVTRSVLGRNNSFRYTDDIGCLRIYRYEHVDFTEFIPMFGEKLPELFNNEKLHPASAYLDNLRNILSLSPRSFQIADDISFGPKQGSPVIEVPRIREIEELIAA